MIYIVAIFILCSGYYTMTYGINLWKNEKNKLGGLGAIFLSIVGSVFPIFFLFSKS